MPQPEPRGAASPRLLAVLFGFSALGLLALSAALTYTGLHPPGASFLPRLFCWIGAGLFTLLGLFSAVLCAYYLRRPAPSQPNPNPESFLKILGIHPPAGPEPLSIAAAARKPLRPARVQPGTQLRQPALQQAMGSLVEALIRSAPQHHNSLHLLVEARQANGKTAFLFTHGSPAIPADYSTLVPAEISGPAFAVADHFLRADPGLAGFEAAMRRTSPTAWDADFRRLSEHGPQWENLPRYPIRVCGFGLSLAPLPDADFRWSRNTVPPGVVAVSRPDPSAPFRQVAVVLSSSGPGVSLGDGVTSAEEVVEISEGPDTPEWRIETPAFHARWPEGLDFRYPLASQSRFDLIGEGNTLLFVQGPASLVRLLDSMETDGQTEIASGKTAAGHDWVEFAYEIADSEWRQRLYTRHATGTTAFVVTAQSPLPSAAQLFRSAGDFTDSLTVPDY